MLIEKLSCCLGVYNFAKIKGGGFIEKILWRNRTNIYSNYMGKWLCSNPICIGRWAYTSTNHNFKIFLGSYNYEFTVFKQIRANMSKNY